MTEEVQNSNHQVATEPPKKKKGFWSKLTSRSSNNDKTQDGEAPKNKSFMTTLVQDAGHAAGKEVADLAEHEVTQQIESAIDNNNNPSQTTSTTSPDTQTTPTDAVNNATSWAKRMVDSAQQKVQSLQNIGS